MSVHDLIEEQDQLIAHRYEFFLWPRQWAAYNLSHSFNWMIHPFQSDQAKHVPREPGIYSFLIQPGITSHPYCSYMMYIGQTCNTLRGRFRDYLDEQNDPNGRKKVVRFLHKYQGYLHFCYSTIAETTEIKKIEDALINAFLPPCNSQFPAEIRPAIGAF